MTTPQLVTARRPRSIIGGQWTVDTWATACACGVEVHLLRRGKLTLLPNGHRCKYWDAQEDQKCTIRAMEACGIRVTEGEAAKRLDDARRP